MVHESQQTALWIVKKKHGVETELHVEKSTL